MKSITKPPQVMIYSNIGFVDHHIDNIKSHRDEWDKYYAPLGMTIAISWWPLDIHMSQYGRESMATCKRQLQTLRKMGIPCMPYNGLWYGQAGETNESWYERHWWDQMAENLLIAKPELEGDDHMWAFDSECYWDGGEYPHTDFDHICRLAAAMAPFLAATQGLHPYHVVGNFGYAQGEMFAMHTPSCVSCSEFGYELGMLPDPPFEFAVDKELAAGRAVHREVFPGFLDDALICPSEGFKRKMKERNLTRYWIFPTVREDWQQNYIKNFGTKAWLDWRPSLMDAIPENGDVAAFKNSFVHETGER